MKFQLAYALILMLTLKFSFAGIISGPINETVFENTNCEANQTCNLKRIKHFVNDYEVAFTPQTSSYGTKMYLLFETSEVEDVKDYVAVQFIKGCQFESILKDGSIKYLSNISKRSFGEVVAFKFPDWITDSIDTDPVYNSHADEHLPRHFGYKWNKVRGSFEESTEDYLRDQMPAHPEIYVRDMPGTAFVDSAKNADDFEYAKNISLEFKICLYKEKDIPLVSTRNNLLEDVTPIHCFSWSSSFIYDHEKKVFNQSKEIHPICL
ncbi:MAG: hypothetical protein A2381_10140 [Bdellovibrionales bacterium RIFOXYB1_FULL_37_110]|nr:MAG: hypothetical protein A2417_02655 [Bdellovibrionales bacterium RIFOXYC1_FULL_37_79]OFZ61124.1 MAG: hypothetical protein A2381_10140 [Bdellovibrionales bacterium RIFOXYB1_FULL_37_110]OFZ61597.1 MAG: hypothetical protein A2577_10440 [Bdellovibrionales bacterium RIFOXYD1_FULL_36_51]